MSLTFHKKLIGLSAKTLNALLEKYESYVGEVAPQGDDRQHYDEYNTAVSLIYGGLKVIKSSRDSLQALIDKLEKGYDEAKSKENKKDLINEIEKMDEEFHLSETIAKANEIIYVLEARSAENTVKMSRVAQKLGINSRKYEGTVAKNNEQQAHGAKPRPRNGTEHESDSTSNQDSAWLTEDFQDTSEEPTEDTICRALKPMQLGLPKFYGEEEEFPEFWAIFKTLVHESKVLNTVEKMLLLKNSLRGRADISVKGIQLVPKNYSWMVDTINKKYGNKPINRARVVQKLIDMRPAADTGDACNNVFDKIRMLINQMVSAGQDIRLLQDALWTEKILEKFPYSIVKNVLISTQDKEETMIQDIMDELEKQIEAKRYVESRLRNFTKYDNRNEKKEKYQRDFPSSDSKQCVFCKKTNHSSLACRTVADARSRREIVKKNQLCWKCFSNSHKSAECNNHNCSRCKQMHDISLCFANASQTGTGQNVDRNQRSPYQNRRNNTLDQRSRYTSRQNCEPLHNTSNNGSQNSRPWKERPSANNICLESEIAAKYKDKEQIVLMTAEGNIFNHRKRQYEKVLFFFDTGAQRTLINKKTASEFDLPKESTEVCTMSGIGGHTEKFESSVVSLRICTAFGEEIELKAHTKPIITKGFSSVRLSEDDKQFLRSKDYCICNPYTRGEHQNPQILVGLDCYYKLVPPFNSAVQLPSGLHIAKTVFGASIHGRGTLADDNNYNDTVMQQLTAISEPSEAELLNKLFELQDMGISTQEAAKEEDTFLYYQNYAKEMYFKEGTITAPLPLKDNVIDLANNYAVAYKRLVSLWKHLQANKEQKTWYCNILSDYVSNNVIEHTNQFQYKSVGCYYMPHSGVWHPSKSRPLRIVFDASSKQSGQLSLNDVMHTGESFVRKIHDILVASRTGKIVLMCDIQAAFTQIRLRDEHKDLCRFLWFGDINKPPSRTNIVEYRFNRVPFGLTASPSILNMAILAFLNHKDTDLAKEVMEHLYVDNILLRASTVEEALEKYRNSKTLFAEIGMNLRDYISNCSEVNIAIPEEDKLQGTVIKLLGVDYNIEKDEFCVKTKVDYRDRLTKRDVVSQLNSIYDPIGVVAPLLVKMKSLMREIYGTGIGWKDRIPIDYHRRWILECEVVRGVAISVPRSITTDDSFKEMYSLWVFCDASQIAMAACGYLQSSSTLRVSQLISGKTRLTPKKAIQTIPRLELLAILLGTRLAKSILSNLSVLISNINIVTDSEIALAWIKSSRKLPPFVINQKNRILMLKLSLEQDHRTHVAFYHVTTNCNPADAGTRGLNARSIYNHAWVRGPRWLEYAPVGSKHTPLRNMDNIHTSLDIVTVEENHMTQSNIIIPPKNVQNMRQSLVDLSRFSKYTQVLRVVATVGKLMQKWVDMCNRHRGTLISTGHISGFTTSLVPNSDDLSLSETLLLILEHKQVDLGELKKRFPQTSIISDEKGIIRFKSRITNAVLPFDTKMPIYIPNNSELARLLLTHIHRKNAHCGNDHVLALARQRFWIPRPAKAIRKFLKNCVVCKRCHGLPFGAPEMPPLPSDRVVIGKAFQNVGCDFLGPFESKDHQKMYVCLYTCLTTRAVHLEVVENMSTAAFLNSFVRFISRRGVPKLIRTDCGSNFKLGEMVIRQMFQNDERGDNTVMSFSATEGIKWIFNPPGAPWMGGVWERLVGSIKRCFNKAVGRRKLSFVEMTTVVTQIEAILNTRPLTKVSKTDIGEIPLRPIDFLQANVKFSLPNYSNSVDPTDRNFDPDLLQNVAQVKEAIEFSEVTSAKFWERWNTDYLTVLRDSHRNCLDQPRHVSKFPEVGEIVLIEQDLLPRGSWVYGCITELIKSADGEIRSAKIRMPNQSTLHRPLNKIYPLEIRSWSGIREEELALAEPPSVNPDYNNITPTSEPSFDNLSRTASRKNPARISKTRARDAIQAFEGQLHTPVFHAGICSPAWIMLAMLLMTIGGVTAQSKLVCANGSAVIKPHNSSIKICFNNACKVFANGTGTLVFKLPSSSKNKTMTVSTRLVNNNVSEIIQCLPLPFCDEAGQFMPMSILGNPHCGPRQAIATVALLIYLIGTTTLMCVCLVFKYAFNRRHRNRRAQPEVMVMQNFKPEPLSLSTAVKSVIVLSTMISSSQACQHGFMRHTVDLVCDNPQNCSYEYNQEVLFNDVHSQLCIYARHGNKTIGTIRIIQNPPQLVCSKVSLFFTRDTEHRLYYVTRCGGVGSCRNNLCNTLKPNENIEELHLVNNYPGYTTCTNTCGGLFCGCLLPIPACTFLRVAQVPKSEVLYEVVRCTEWVPVINFHVDITLKNSTTSHNFSLAPYITQTHSGLSLTVIASQIPHSNLLDQQFAISSKEVLKIPNNYELTVQCPTPTMATNSFINCTNQMLCLCKNLKAPQSCHCTGKSISEIREFAENRLPIVTPFIDIFAHENLIRAVPRKVELTLSIRSNVLIEVANYVLDQRCSVYVSPVIGCYNCQEGAQFTVFCSTLKDTAITVQCKTQAFSVRCGPSNETTEIPLNFHKATLEQKCMAICHKELVILHLRGQLHYKNRHLTSIIFEDSGNQTTLWPSISLSELQFPDLEPLIDTISLHWKLALFAVTSAVISVGVTYSCGPLLIVFVLKIVWTVTQKIITSVKNMSRAVIDKLTTTMGKTSVATV